jgi:hypothetical protein
MLRPLLCMFFIKYIDYITIDEKIMCKSLKAADLKTNKKKGKDMNSSRFFSFPELAGKFSHSIQISLW